jgi:two-component system, chemotaxis family, chemotaxis protein CheY
MKNILVVDDSATMRRMVKTCLKELPDVQLHDAASGLEAIERLAITSMDLMILDLNMPDMHGLEVLRFVREHQALQKIPIVVLTTKGDEATRGEAMKRGASVYLTKPFVPAELVRHAQLLMKENAHG